MFKINFNLKYLSLVSNLKNILKIIFKTQLFYFNLDLWFKYVFVQINHFYLFKFLLNILKNILDLLLFLFGYLTKFLFN